MRYLFLILFTFVSLTTHAVSVPTRLKNIELMRDTLKKSTYDGYDIIIISSTSQDEANYQQQNLERAFAGKPIIILSVVDSIESGQLIGSVYTWMQAEKMMHDKYPISQSLLDYVRSNHLKVALFHNGGRGERCSPLTQSLGNSRGALKLVGSTVNAVNQEVELDVLLGVVLQCSSFAITNPGTHIDTFWTSQIAFGSNLHESLSRSNYGIDKFLVGFNKDELIPQNIADFGTAALSQCGRMIAFYGNKRFAARKGSEYVVDVEKIQNELLNKGERVAYDFGSFSTSFDMWQLICDYWSRKISSKMKRDIDPHFIQPFVRFLYGMNDLTDRNAIDIKLPQPDSLITQMQLVAAREVFDKLLSEEAPEAHDFIRSDGNEIYMNEVMEFYLLYRNTAPFENLEKVFGFIDLGDETQWFRYRRPIDIMNEKLEMLADLSGNKLEIELNGNLHESNADAKQKQRSREARLMRGISQVTFSVEGKPIVLTFEEVQTGIDIEGVYIKDSIIQKSNLSKGSIIINSVVNNSTGKIIADYSYLESVFVPSITATKSIVHQVVDQDEINADTEVVSDVFRTKLNPPYHGRMRAHIGYDPKGPTINDTTLRTEDGRFTFDQIREIEPLRLADDAFRDSLINSQNF